MKTSTLPIICIDENDLYFLCETKVTCYQRKKFKGDVVWLDDNGNEYFREKVYGKFGFKKCKH